jgi:hypothetical protein
MEQEAKAGGSSKTALAERNCFQFGDCRGNCFIPQEQTINQVKLSEI